MDAQYFIETRPPHATIALFGEVTENNDRIALLQVRPGMQEGERCGLMLKEWGQGDQVRCDGQIRFFDTREAAINCAETWINTGRNPVQDIFK